MILLLCESRPRTGKNQVTAKENPRAHSSPFCKAWVVAKKKSWQTRAFFATASLRSTPGKRGTSTPGRKSSLLLSSEVKGRAARQPLLHEIGHRQREPTSTNLPRFAKLRSLPSKSSLLLSFKREEKQPPAGGGRFFAFVVSQHTDTRPVWASRVTTAPLFKRSVACSAPVMTGLSMARPAIAAWELAPDSSVMMPEARRR